MSEKNTGTILLELLEHTKDANQLEVLLEPSNLLYLLTQNGRTETTVKSALQSGTKPGELLLALFHEEHTADELIASLPEARREAGKATKTETAVPRKAPAKQPIPTIQEDDWAGSLLGKYTFYLAIGVVALTAVLPAMALTGFLPMDIFSTTMSTTLFSAVVGAVAGLFYIPGRKISWRGSILGLLLNVGILWAVILYTMNRQTILRLELAIPLLLGVIPAFGVNALLVRLFERQKPEMEA